MGALPLTVLLLGDEAEDVTFNIEVLYRKSQTSTTLNSFLQEASHACQVAFGKLPQCARDGCPSFTSLLDMSKNHAKVESSSALSGFALAYFARLGEMVYRSEKDPSLFFSRRNMIIGSGTGLLPAAVVAVSTSSPTVVMNGLECFPACFNFITECYYRTVRIESSNGSWSYTIADDYSEQELKTMLNTVHDELDIPYHKEAWLAGNCAGQKIICGPPSTLKKLRARLPGHNRGVSIALHAPHLPPISFDKTSMPQYLQEQKVRYGCDIMSPYFIEPYTATRLGDLLDSIAQDLSQRTPNMRLLLEEMAGDTMEYTNMNYKGSIIQLGPSCDTAFFASEVAGNMIPESDLECKPGSGRGYDSAAVAVVGVSMRMPKADNMEQLWDLMMAGNTTRAKIPRDRFDMNKLHGSTFKDTAVLKAGEGCFLSSPGAFDPHLFNLSPGEAAQIKPSHRLLLMSSLEALEAAGYNAQGGLPRVMDRTALYFGQDGPVRRVVSAKQGLEGYTTSGLLKAFSTISNELDSNGSGCSRGLYDTNPYFSSSATAIQTACVTLMNRECDVALAGGAHVIDDSLAMSQYKSDGCRAFRQNDCPGEASDGCRAFRQNDCPGEAAGVLVLKRLDDAIANGDKVEAVISGWCCNYPLGPVLNIQPPFLSTLWCECLDKAGIELDDVAYAEHDGAKAGATNEDEVYTISNLADGYLARPLPIGTLKANVGHSGSAAGVSSVIRALMMLKKRMIPPQAEFPEDKVDDMLSQMLVINTKPTELNDSKKTLLVHDMDGAGANTNLIIQPAPESANYRRLSDPRRWHVVAISAASQAALQDNAFNLRNFLSANKEVKLANIGYTTTARRMHYPIRQHLVASSTLELANLLSEVEPMETVIEKPQVVFVFSGHGHDYSGIVEELYQSHEVFRSTLDRLEKLCIDMHLTKRKNFLDCLKTTWSRICPPVELSLAIVCIEIALAELWQSWGVKPDLVIGHDLGEYAALCIAGVLSAADTLWLTSKRAELARAFCRKYEWATVLLNGKDFEVDGALKASGAPDSCHISWSNSRFSHAVCGLSEELSPLVNHGHLEAVKPTILKVPYAFHSEQMQVIAKHLQGHANGIPFNSPQIPVASTLTGKVISRKGVLNAEYLQQHIQSPIKFVEALEAAHFQVDRRGSSSLWVGIGHTEPLVYARDTLNLSPSQLLPSLETGENNFKTIAASVGHAYSAGIDVNWPEFHRPFQRSVQFIDLPTYAFDLIDCGLDVRKGPSQKTSVPENNVSTAERIRRAFKPTATVQHIESQKISETMVEVSFISSLTDGRFEKAIKGNEIEGHAVCPVSVYVDMATTAASYIRKLLLRSGGPYLAWIQNLELVTPFKLANPLQTVRITITANLKDDYVAEVSIHSKGHTSAVSEHCTCQVPLKKARNEDQVTSDLSGINKIDQMTCDLVDQGKCSRFKVPKDEVYKSLSPSLGYGARYQGVNEAIITRHNSPIGFEKGRIHAIVKIPHTSEDESLRAPTDTAINPYHLESLMQIASFVAMDYLDESEKQDWTYICTEIGDLRLYKALKEGEEYYVSPCTVLNTGTELQFCIAVSRPEDRTELIAYVNYMKFRKIKQSELRNAIKDGRSLDDLTLFRHSHVILPLRERSMSTETDSPIMTPPSAGSQQSIQDAAEQEQLRDELNTIQGLNSGTIIDLEDQADTDLKNDGADEDEELYSDSEDAPLDPKMLRSEIVHVSGIEPSPYKFFFLIPGAGGTADVFHGLANLPSQRPVMVLESPIAHIRSNAHCKPSDLTRAYISAIMGCGQKGPFLIGGYAEGAIYAYEVARAMAMMYGSNVVEKLILIDMKAHLPGQLGTVKPTFWDITKLSEALDLGTDRKAEQKLMHKDALCAYNWKPEPMEEELRPISTTVIWAKDGMCERDEDAEFETEFPCKGPDFVTEKQGYLAWFHERRHAYDAGGWDTLIGEKVKIRVTDGDHFNMIEMPESIKLAEVLDEVLREVTLSKRDAKARKAWVDMAEDAAKELKHIGDGTSGWTTRDPRSVIPRGTMRTGRKT
ncbi:hypothetical protein F5Y18DRAFT_436852 [Xylariaceae sp. FL1019]|nr:hypothetical protein F5Y18DRAFT_436852 [Xylariaceae sp. FL1019]